MKILNKYSDVIPQIERELLLSHALKLSREDLYTNNIFIDEETEKIYDSLVKRRSSGEPLQYVLGKESFMGLDFIVNKNAFIPRPETEALVKEIIKYSENKPKEMAILDLCTGCGNIAVSLARLIPHSRITAVDISAAAVETAQKNAILHNVDKSISFYRQDIFQELLFDKNNIFDIIVSNLPYIKKGDLKSLQKEVRCEPEIALDGGEDGLKFYTRIAEMAPRYLASGGALFLEIGFDQAQDIIDIFASSNLYKICKVKKDFSGIDRVIWITLL